MSLLAAGMLAVTSFGSCNDSAEKTEAVVKDSSTLTTPALSPAPAPVVVVDSTQIKRQMDSLKMLSDTPKLKKAKLKPVVSGT